MLVVQAFSIQLPDQILASLVAVITILQGAVEEVVGVELEHLADLVAAAQLHQVVELALAVW